MSDLKTKLNSCGYSFEYKKLVDLEINTPYSVTNFENVNTQYGSKLGVILNNKIKVILPDRFKNMSVNFYYPDSLNMIYKGKKEITNNRSIHEIVFVDSDANH